jgi:hypothetical protein
MLITIACVIAAALLRRFQPVYVLEPSEGETLEILKGLSERYERHHRWVVGKVHNTSMLGGQGRIGEMSRATAYCGEATACYRVAAYCGLAA